MRCRTSRIGRRHATALDQRHPHPFLSKQVRRRDAGKACADDDDIDFKVMTQSGELRQLLSHPHGLRFRWVAFHFSQTTGDEVWFLRARRGRPLTETAEEQGARSARFWRTAGATMTASKR